VSLRSPGGHHEAALGGRAVVNGGLVFFAFDFLRLSDVFIGHFSQRRLSHSIAQRHRASVRPAFVSLKSQIDGAWGHDPLWTILWGLPSRNDLGNHQSRSGKALSQLIALDLALGAAARSRDPESKPNPAHRSSRCTSCIGKMISLTDAPPIGALAEHGPARSRFYE
jgi:hypothetical protein